MKDCFLIKFVSLYTLLHFILLPVLQVSAAVPKFVQLTSKDNFILNQVSTLNAEVNFFQFEFDCFNTDVVVDEIAFKAFGDYVVDFFDEFKLLNLSNDDVLSSAILANGLVTFTEDFACLNNNTMHLMVVGNLSDQVDRDFSFGLKMLSDDHLELAESLLEYAEFPLNGTLISLNYVEPEVIEDEQEVEPVVEEVESEQEDVLEQIMTKMHEILDEQAKAQLDVNNFFVDSLGRIQTKTDALQESLATRDAEFNAQIIELVNLVSENENELDLNQLIEFIQENQPEGIDEQQLTAAVVEEINKLLPKTEEVVLVNDSTLDVSNVRDEQLEEVVTVLAELMQSQADLQAQIARERMEAEAQKVPVIGDVNFSEAVNQNEFLKNSFVDLVEGSELSLAATELYRRGVVNGYANGFFLPERQINRAEALKILLTLRFGEVGQLPLESSFVDVRSEDWFYKYVLMANHLGAVSGFDDGTFRPFENVTLAQFLKMMTVIFELPTNLDSVLNDQFANDWYAPYVGFVTTYDLWEGSAFDFNYVLRRADAALVLYRYLKNR